MADAPRDSPYTELLERLIAELDEIQQANVNEKAYLFNSFLDRVLPQLEEAVDADIVSQLAAFRVPTPTGRHIIDHTRNTLATTNVRDCRNLLATVVRRLTDEAAPQSNLTQRKLDSLKSFLDELNNIEAAAPADGYSKMEQRFARWKDRCVRFIADNISDDEAKKLSRYKLLDSNPTIARRRHEHTVRTFRQCRSFLEVMIEEIRTHGEGIYSPAQPALLTRQEAVPAPASVVDAQQPKETAVHEQANELYEKARALSRYVKPLEASIAKIIIETANDAIKEFGNTNQEKKVELKRMIEEAGMVLPPATFKELTERAEGQLLRKTHPKSHTSRSVILWAVLLFTLIGSATIWTAVKYLRPTGVKPDAKDATTARGVLSPISLTVRPAVENATEVVQSLRASRQLRSLAPFESGKSIEATPAGTFFFVYASYLSQSHETTEQLLRGGGAVSSVKRTGSDFEVHKISEAEIEVMAFVSNDTAQAVSRLDGNLKKEITLSPAPWGGSTTMILIPYHRIQATKIRDIDVDEKTSMSVLDVTLQ